jgi:hypothetical protein
VTDCRFFAEQTFMRRAGIDQLNCILPEPPLFGQDADRKACKYEQEHNRGGGGKFVVTLLQKDSKHQDHAQNRQQNE